MQPISTFWVERHPNKFNKFVYEVIEEKDFTTIFLVNNYQGRMAQVNCIGFVTKVNKRGLTFRSCYLSKKYHEHFLSNGDFDQYTQEEWDQLNFYNE